MAETITLPYQARPWQREVHAALKRFSVLACHRRAGKTVLAIEQLVASAMRCTKEMGRYAYIAPYLKQAKRVAWSYLKRTTGLIPGAKAHEQESYVTLPNGARIMILGADDADSLRGIYLDGLVLDEVAQMDPVIWEEVLRPALSDRHGWALFIGTPKGSNLFSELYMKAKRDPEWYAGLYTVRDTTALPIDEVARVERDLKPNVFAREYLCDFSVAGPNQLLSANEVDRACCRSYHESDIAHAPRIIGADIARQGDDATVIIARQGMLAREPIVMQGADSMAVADRIAHAIESWGPDAVFIDGSGGYGAGVIDRLRTLKHTVHEVQFGGVPADQRYANKRAEMWHRCADWVKGSGQIPRCQRLVEDLCAPTYEHDRKDRLTLESKDDLRDRGMPSSDYGDALCLTFAMPVISKSDRRPAQVISDYDPYAQV